MSRYVYNSYVLVKGESGYAADANPSEAADAVLCSEIKINPLNAQNVPRDLIRGYFGGAEHLVGVAFVELELTVELAGAGAAGTGAPYKALLDACGLNETLTASVRAEYNLETPVVGSCTIDYHDDGLVHTLLGARGSATFDMKVGSRPTATFKMLGIDGGVAAGANSAVTLTAWKKPDVVTDANTGDLLLGCTYVAATPALTGGTGYPSQGLEWDLGIAVSHTPLLGGEAIDATQREVQGKIVLDLTAAQEVTFMAAVKANTLQSMGLMHGTVAGYKILTYFAAVQLLNPSKVEVNKRRMIGFDFRAVPVSGNDEVRLVVH